MAPPRIIGRRSGIAQSVEQAAVNRKVQGSSPCPGASLASGVAPRYCGAGTNGPHILVAAAMRGGRPKKDSNSCFAPASCKGGGSSPPRPTTDVILAQLTTQMACSWSLHGLVRKVVVGVAARCPNSASESVSITQVRHFSSGQP